MLEVNSCNVFFALGTSLETHALQDVNVVVEEGDFVSVIGSNGAGKSTFLNMIAGEIQPNSGVITIDGNEIQNLTVHQRASMIARVFQNPLLGSCVDLTIAENMALAYGRGDARTLKVDLPQTNLNFFREKLLLLNLGLETRLQDKVGMLSGGQRQALSLLMTTLKPLRILLLDEHTSALDPKASAMTLDLTARFIEEQKLTTIMVTHSMQQAIDYGNRLLMFHQGKLINDISKEKKKHLTSLDLLNMFDSYK